MMYSDELIIWVGQSKLKFLGIITKLTYVHLLLYLHLCGTEGQNLMGHGRHKCLAPSEKLLRVLSRHYHFGSGSLASGETKTKERGSNRVQFNETPHCCGRAAEESNGNETSFVARKE